MELLIHLLVVLLVVAIVFYVVQQIPMDPWMRNVVIAILGLIVVIYLITMILPLVPPARSATLLQPAVICTSSEAIQ